MLSLEVIVGDGDYGPCVRAVVHDQESRALWGATSRFQGGHQNTSESRAGIRLTGARS